MSRNCDVILVFLIYCQFEAIQKPDSGRIVCKAYLKRTLVLKGIFSETTYVGGLSTKFQVFSKFLTSFRQHGEGGGLFNLPTPRSPLFETNP